MTKHGCKLKSQDVICEGKGTWGGWADFGIVTLFSCLYVQEYFREED